jgi:hypothetical protein
MKKILLYLSLGLGLWASEHYAKAEPYRYYLLQANVTGQVLFADESLEGKQLGKTPFIRIDDELDKKELQLLKAKKKNLKKSLTLNEQMAENLSVIIEKKRVNYERIKDLPIKSNIEKDKEFFDLSASQNQYLSSLEKIETLRSQLSDTRLRMVQLEKSITDKSIRADKMVLYKLHVKAGQVVSSGMNLAEVADVSKAKLTIFLNQESLASIHDKTIYLNGEKTAYQIDRIWPLSDDEHISAYRSEIIIEAPKQFSSLYKIEFK